MATTDPRPQRRGGRVVLAALGAWVAVIVVGAGKRADDSLLGVDHLDVVWSIVLVIGAILGLVMLVVLNPFSTEWTAPARRRGGGMWVILLLALALMVWRPDLLDRFTEEDDEPVSGEIFEIDDVGPADEAAPETVAQATDLLLLVTVVAATGGAWYLLKRRGEVSAPSGPAAETDDRMLEADLLAALDDLSAELSDNDDPRTAVLQSYAVLESVLAANGSTRAAYETPTEHLRRALQGLRVDASPFLRLGELYEIARFSDQAISPDRQRHAARLLDAARRSLAELR